MKPIPRVVQRKQFVLNSTDLRFFGGWIGSKSDFSVYTNSSYFFGVMNLGSTGGQKFE